MSSRDDVTRRAALVAGTAALASGSALARPKGKDTTIMRMPVVFMPHGGGPWPFVDIGLPKHELDALAAYLRSVRSLPLTPPKALLVISAHWEAAVPTVMTSHRPPMLYDYYGFPPESYQVQWPAPGEPALAAKVQRLLTAAGIPNAADGKRGFDHGTFVPLKLTYPEASVPTVQLSLKAGLDPAEHLAIGRAIAPLRDEGVFIVGSGMTFHNMRAFGNPQAATPHANRFDDWLRETGTLPAELRDDRLTSWTAAPSARFAHPREEHLLPLMVIAGAAGTDRGSVAYHGKTMGLPLSAYHFG